MFLSQISFTLYVVDLESLEGEGSEILSQN